MKVINARSTRMKDIFTPNPVCVTGDTSAWELGRIFDANEISGAPVVDASDRLIGVVSRTDLLHRYVEQGLDPDWDAATFKASLEAWDPSHLGVVSDFMNPEPVTASPDDDVPTVARRLREQGVHRVIVIDRDRHVIGIVTTMDLLKAIAS